MNFLANFKLSYLSTKIYKQIINLYHKHKTNNINNQNSINGVNDSKLVNKMMELYESKIEHLNGVIDSLNEKK